MRIEQTSVHKFRGTAIYHVNGKRTTKKAYYEAMLHWDIQQAEEEKQRLWKQRNSWPTMTTTYNGLY